MTTLGDRLEAERQRLFVGRAVELAAFEVFLTDPRRLVLYVQGMGGIGKSELLRAFARQSRDRGWAVTELDARDVPQTADGLRSALLGAVAVNGPRLILLDTFELLSALERPLRRAILPALPASCRVVMAGRNRLGRGWTADGGWSQLLEIIELGELTHAEGREYLERKRTDPSRIDEILELAGGLPLALSLVAAASRTTPAGELADDADITETILSHLLDRAPSPAHYRALAVSALGAHTTDEILRHAVPAHPAAELYEWLASQPAFTADAQGIYPHDQLRRALIRRLRWRRPELFFELLLTMTDYQMSRLRRQLRGPAAPEVVRAIQFLMAQSALGPMLIESYYRFQATELSADDWPMVEDILRRQTGPAGVAHLEAWLDHPAFETLAVRRSDDVMVGFHCGVQLHRLAAEEAQRIPGVDVFWERFGPFERPASYLWMWGDARAGHEVSPTQTSAMSWIANQILDDPDCIHSAFVVQEGLGWIHGGTVRTSPKPVPECAFQLGRARYLVINKSHDTKPPIEWFLDMTEEFVELLEGAGASRSADAPPGTASMGAILGALKAALKHVDRPDLIGDNPLLDLVIVAERTSGCADGIERGRALSDFLRELAGEILESPRDEIHMRALIRTFFEPGAKQRTIAAELGLGYSTYRRYLATTIERLADGLYQRELEAHHSA